MGNQISRLRGIARAGQASTNATGHADSAGPPEVQNDATLFSSGCSITAILESLPTCSSNDPETGASKPLSPRSSCESSRLSFTQVSPLQGPDHLTDLSTQPLYIRLDCHDGNEWILSVSDGMASGPFVTWDPSGDERICFTGPAHIFYPKIECRPEELTDVVNKGIRDGKIRLRLENAKSHCFKVGTIHALFQPQRGVDWFIADLEGKFLSDFNAHQLGWMSTFRCPGESMNIPISGIAMQYEWFVNQSLGHNPKLISVCDLTMEMSTPADCVIAGHEYKAEHVLTLKVVRGKPSSSMSGSPVAILNDDRTCTLLGQITGLVPPICEEDGQAVKYILVLPFAQMQQVMFEEFRTSFSKPKLEVPNYRPRSKIYRGATNVSFSASITDSSGFESQ